MPLSPRGRRDYSPGARRSASPTRKGRSAYGESRAIFLGNISNDATYEDIAHLFSPYSDIANIDLKQDFAFVFLENPDRGDDAIRKLDRSTFLDRRIRVEWAKGNGRVKRREAERRHDAENRPNKTLFVVNFSRNTKDRDLQNLFEPFGKITRVDVRNNYAFVEFDNLEDAKAAKQKLHQSRLDNHVITVEYQAEKRGSGSERYVPVF
ncbi:RRM domain-containing protein [Plasmodiophora brassicae]|uniref:RRM domain-containing protein n=1 Tax=Plasmodiophora brassicae TaxID=37360 RepID=A0A0G4ILI4_PLABS|nr:hypothetical protein PBRA_004670 [Plasmodiophora brassicae]